MNIFETTKTMDICKDCICLIDDNCTWNSNNDSKESTCYMLSNAQSKTHNQETLLDLTFLRSNA